MNASEIKKIACIGSGLIGASWATNFLMKGYKVNIYDIDEKLLAIAKERIERDLEFLVSKNVIEEDKLEQIEKNVTFTTDMEIALKDVQFIQESGPEKYEIKHEILAEVDKYASPNAIFASSTSGLLITEIAKFSKHSQRCIGAHPYNPPHLIPLVEITKGDNTSQEALDAAYEFYKLLGKEPIILKKEALGFIANRLQMALYREAVDLVNRGVCTVEDVDKATCYGPGLRYATMGPNLLYHLGGGPYGIRGILSHIGPSVEMWWKDMADWKTWPEGWKDIVHEGVEESILGRAPEMGNNVEDLVKFRDDMLLELLKLHKKL